MSTAEEIKNNEIKFEWHEQIIDIDVSTGGHTMFLTNRKHLYGVGANGYGQLGIGHRIDQTYFVRINQTIGELKSNIKVKSKGEKSTLMCVLRDSTIFVTNNNKIKGMGRNQFGQLGIGDYVRYDGKETEYDFPTEIYLKHLFTRNRIDNIKVEALKCGSETVFAIIDKKLYGWGRNDHYQLGKGTQRNHYLPTEITFFNQVEEIKDIYPGEQEIFAIGKSGKIYGWGRSYWGQLGLGIDYNQIVPREIAFFKENYGNISQVSAGDGFSIINVGNNTVYGTGMDPNRFGPNEMYVSAPVILNITSNHQVIEMKSKNSTAGILFDNGRLLVAGDNRYHAFEQDAYINEFNDTLKNMSISKIAIGTHSIVLEGFMCGDEVDSSPNVCSNHGQCATRNGTCICELGYSNEFSRWECEICPAGTYSVFTEHNLFSKCTNCPPSTYSNTTGAHSISTCNQCPLGTITVTPRVQSISECIQCGQGTYARIINDISYCQDCQKGTWSDSFGAYSPDTCIPCIAGTFSPDLQAKSIDNCISCEPGTYSETVGAPNNLTCIDCPKGTYSSIQGANAEELCYSCPLGSYSETVKSTSCVGCPQFQTTSSIGTFNGTQCKFCEVGSYASLNNETNFYECVACQEGTFSNTSKANSSDVCTPCPVGYASTAIGATNISTCKICPINTYAGKGFSHCQPCSIGTFSSAGSEVCTTCPVGYIIVVPFDEITDDPDHNCDLCYRGTWTHIVNSDTFCIDCVAGTWSDVKGAKNDSVCQSCTAGTYSEIPGANSESFCLDCPNGTYSGILAASRLSDCIKCEPGYYSTAFGATTIDTCQKCPRGTFNEIQGAGTIEKCYNCPAGTFSNDTAVNNKSSCALCPKQTYSHEGSTYCTECPRGHYTISEGSSSIADCIPCPYGTYFATENNETKCHECPVGTYSPVLAAYNRSTCLECSPGTYANETATRLCHNCIPGTYLVEHGATDVSSCIPCVPGYFSTIVAATTPDTCQSCIAGTYTEQHGSTSCDKCSPGTYSETVAAFNETFCLDCPKGTYSEAFGAFSPDTCNPCRAGTYNEEEGSPSESKCLECPLGTASQAIGATTSSVCELCYHDMYNDETGQAVCKNCPEGTITTCSFVIGSSECLLELDNLGTPFGRTSVSQCRSCRAGTYKIINENKIGSCVLCEKGTYSTVEGASSNATCIHCGSGFYTENSEFPEGGADRPDACIPCTPGRFSPNTKNSGFGIDACSICPIGTWSPSASAQCIECIAGTFSNSTEQGHVSSCQSCKPGYWSNIRSSECVPCIPGTFSNVTRAISNETCLDCRAGTASSIFGADGEEKCIPCPKGYFSSKERSTECTPCPAGTIAGQEGSTTCIGCPKGTFSLAASSSCTLCNTGTYSNIEAATTRAQCVLCPQGQYNPETGKDKCIKCDGWCPQGASAELPFISMFEKADAKILVPTQLIDNTMANGLMWGFVALIIVCTTIVFLIILGCSTKSNGCKGALAKFKDFDFWFHYLHFIDINDPQVKRKTILGGICSVITISAIVVLFIITVTNVFAFNVITRSNFKIVDSQTTISETDSESSDPSIADSTYGRYKYEISIMGNIPHCIAIDRSQIDTTPGFVIQTSGIESASDEEGNIVSECTSYDDFGEEKGVKNCRCTWTCTKCTLEGVSQFVKIVSRNTYASVLAYEVSVPYYERDTADKTVRLPFILNGTIVAPENELFYGIEDHPIEMFLSMFDTIYTSTPNVIFAAIGRSKTHRTGVIGQVQRISYGSTISATDGLDDNPEKGLNLVFSLSRPNLIFTQEEELDQNLSAFLASLAALSGIVGGTTLRILTQLENNYHRVVRWTKAGISKTREFFRKREEKKNEIVITVNRKNEVEKKDPWSLIKELEDGKTPHQLQQQEVNRENANMRKAKDPWSFVDNPSGKESTTTSPSKKAIPKLDFTDDRLFKNFSPKTRKSKYEIPLPSDTKDTKEGDLPTLGDLYNVKTKNGSSIPSSSMFNQMGSSTFSMDSDEESDNPKSKMDINNFFPLYEDS